MRGGRTCGNFFPALVAELIDLQTEDHGPGHSRLYFVDRVGEFSIYDVDFLPIPGAEALRNPGHPRLFHVRAGDRAQIEKLLQNAAAVSVQGDPVQLEAALAGSLLYMLQRDRHTRRQMEISTVQIGRFVHLRMLDNGQPIANAQFELALDRMGQDSAQHFSQSLWLSRAIIEHHGGAMNVHTEEGRTGISLQLPVLEEAS